MKIIGGKLKGRNFYMPKDIRPTQSVARKAIFDILGQNLDGLSFIDLFAGSGAVGLEAISHNAARVWFVEKELKHAQVIKDNLVTLGIGDGGSFEETHFVITSDVFVAIEQMQRRQLKFDIVFADPPFGRDLAKKALKTLGAYDIVHPSCYIIIQHHKREILPEGEGRFVLVKRKKYGLSNISIYEGE